MDEPTDIPELYTEHADIYQRSLGYPQGLRAVFLKSPALVPDMRILDAGCGTGITTLALRQALETRGVSGGEIDAFDLTPAMLSRFRAMLARSDIEGIRLMQADVLQLDALPPTWSGYDLVVTASMLEYVPR
jgi:ubiquinone/menaquinone biosynthesis C-methylase UbiE